MCLTRRQFFRTGLAVGAALASDFSRLKRAEAQVAPDPVLTGTIDFHVHSDPDIFPRSVDDLTVAKQAQEAGIRAIVLKNHFMPTYDRAYLARKVVPGIEVFGGIALNKSIGGLNPEAVVAMLNTRGGYGKVVWFPTFDADNHLKRFPRKEEGVRTFDQAGKLMPTARDILQLIADHDLILETGHLSAAEALWLIREAKQVGVKRIVVTHAMTDPIRMSIEEMREAASLGAFIEHVYLGVLEGPNSLVPLFRDWVNVPISEYARATKAVGAQHFILSSDLGQANNPLHRDGYRTFVVELMKTGISGEEIDLMARKNPAGLLGLTVS